MSTVQVITTNSNLFWIEFEMQRVWNWKSDISADYPIFLITVIRQVLNCEAKNKLKVLNFETWILPEMQTEFHRNNTEMLSVDTFHYKLPMTNFELLGPLNRSVISLSAMRCEQSSFTTERWITLNENLLRLASHPKNADVANNLYNAEYSRFFTGLQVDYVPSF